MLRPVEPSDAEAIQAISPKWKIVRFLKSAVPWPYPEDGRLTDLRNVALPPMAAGQACVWTIRLAAEPVRLIGSIGLYDKPGNDHRVWA